MNESKNRSKHTQVGPLQHNIRENNPKMVKNGPNYRKAGKNSNFFYKIVKQNIFTIPFGTLPHIVFLNQKIENLIPGALVHKITHRLDQVDYHAILIHFHVFILIFSGQFFILCHPKIGGFSPRRKSGATYRAWHTQKIIRFSRMYAAIFKTFVYTIVLNFFKGKD